MLEEQNFYFSQNNTNISREMLHNAYPGYELIAQRGLLHTYQASSRSSNCPECSQGLDGGFNVFAIYLKTSFGLFGLRGKE